MNFLRLCFFVGSIFLSDWRLVLGQDDVLSADGKRIANIDSSIANGKAAAAAVDEIATGVAEIEAASEMDEKLLQSLLDLYKQAKAFQATAASRQDKAKTLKQMTVSAADDIATLSEKLKAPVEKIETPSERASPELLRQELATTQAEYDVISNTLKSLVSETATRQKRLAEIPSLISSAEKMLRDVEEQLALSNPTTESPVETRARLARTNSHQAALKAEVAELQAEQAAYLATTDLLPLQRQWAERQQSQLRIKLDFLREASILRKQESNDEAMSILQRQIELVPDALKELATSNYELAQRRQSLLSEASQSNALANRIKEKQGELEAALIASEGRLETVGLTQAIGQLLRSKRDEYEKVRLRFQTSSSLDQQIAVHQVAAYELEDRLSSLTESLASLGDIEIPDTDADIAELDTQQAKYFLLVQQRNETQETLQSQTALLQALLLVEASNQQLHQSIDEYTAFVDKNIFWIRSDAPVSIQEIMELPSASRWLISSKNWADLANQLFSGIISRPIMTLIGASGVLALFVRRPAMRKAIAKSGESAKAWNAGFQTTATSLVATFLLAFGWPSLAAIVGIVLIGGQADTLFTRGFASACIYVALFVSSRHLLSQTCREGGLADKHFGWSVSLRRMLRRNLQWYTNVGFVLVFVMLLFHEHPDSTTRTAVSRLAATLLLLATALFHHFISKPKSPIYDDIRIHYPDSLFCRFRRLVWIVAVGSPASFAGLALLGYLDTAYRLGQSLQSTMLLLVALIVLVALAFRWLHIYQARIVREQLMEMRRKKLANDEDTTGGSLATDVGIEIQKEAMEDLPALSEQTRKLVFVVAWGAAIVGMSLVWKDVLPAMQLLDRFELWTVGSGAAIDLVSLRDLILSFLSVFITILAVKNVPALLELIVLRQTSLDTGARYAVTTILRYLITIGGVILALNFLSLPWTKLGWLVAAASVGLGFGLQEIFANFVSGIILLLERPVRVGDVVTIDSTTGVVSRIQMRATTVTSWDRKELVVPNKDLVTGKLLNWSLSNVINRMTIEVGVSYDADPDDVRTILQKVVTDNAEVMTEPPPLINFETFGESSLNFVVRFYLSSLERRVAVMHDLNAGIWRALRNADIAIPYPQRDVHFIAGNKSDSIPTIIQECSGVTR